MALLRMPTDRFRNSLSDHRHKARVFQLANRRVRLGGNILELVVPVELNFPSQSGELLYKTGIDKMNGAFVNTSPRLRWEFSMLDASVPKYECVHLSATEFSIKLAR